MWKPQTSNGELCQRAALVLNAGQSLRMGKPKASLSLNLPVDPSQTFLDRATELAAVGCSHGPRVIVCSPANLREVDGFITTTNRNPEKGMYSSIVVGVRAILEISESIPSVMILLIDHPVVKPETILRLWAVHEEHPEAVVVPRYEKLAGHPVVLAPAIVDRVANGNRRSRLDKVISEAQVVEMPVSDAGVVLNINTPEAYRKYMGS